jgi:DNA-binding CsgD family transcriptional regulator
VRAGYVPSLSEREAVRGRPREHMKGPRGDEMHAATYVSGTEVNGTDVNWTDVKAMKRTTDEPTPDNQGFLIQLPGGADLESLIRAFVVEANARGDQRSSASPDGGPPGYVVYLPVEVLQGGIQRVPSRVPAQGSRSGEESLPEHLTKSERRVLHYLPTRLAAHEIGRELYVSVNTVKTHMRRLYSKLGVHTRREAVDRAAALGLLTSGAAARA